VEEKILKIFKRCGNGYVSGEEISNELGVSRTSIWKHIETLRHLGYDIEATPHLGYKLKTRPDRLIPEELRDNLRTRYLGSKIVAYEVLNSTNDTAYHLAENGEKEGTVVISERQRKGRGRQRRHWVSPPGGIYLSCILKPDIEPKEVAKITLVAAVAVCVSVREITGAQAMIKWPNDILISRKKVCGILTEMKAEQDKVDFLVVGIGINVTTAVRCLPKGATSLARESEQEVSKVALTKKVLEHIEEYLGKFKDEGFSSIRAEWHRYSTTIGHYVRVQCHDERIEGEALDVDEDGALVIRLDNGFQKRVLSGDVVIAH